MNDLLQETIMKSYLPGEHILQANLHFPVITDGLFGQ